MFPDAEVTRRALAIDGSSAKFAVCELGPHKCVAVQPHESSSALQVIRGTLYVRDAGLPAVAVRAGRVVLIPGGARFEVGSCPRAMAGEARHDSVLRHHGDWTIADARGGERREVIVATMRLPGVVDIGSDRLLVCAKRHTSPGARAFTILREEVERRDAGGAAFAATMMNACVALALRSAGEQPSTRPAMQPGIERVAATIRTNPADAYDMASLSALAGMSRATFARQFVARLRMTPMQFVLRARLEEAADILRTTSLPVKSVAARAGFASRSHFSRAFRAVFGRDPTGFRDDADTI